MLGGLSDSALAARISATYRAARESYVAYHKSRHWDIFPADYAQRLADPTSWPRFRSNGLTRRFDEGVGLGAAGDSADDPDLRDATLRRFHSLKDVTGEEFLRAHHEAGIGCPLRILHDGMALNTTDLRLCHDAWQIAHLLSGRRDAELTLVEIGAGFGGLARKLKRLFPKARLLLFDLPEVNAVQTYYLARAFPAARIVDYTEFRESGGAVLATEGRDLAILPGWCIEAVRAASVDAIINTRSMAEMSRQTIAYYFDQIHRIARDGTLFYCVNRYTKSTVGEPIRLREYPFDDRWLTLVSRPVWDQPWIHELAALRLPHAVPFSTRQVVAQLPPRRWIDMGSRLGEAWRTLVAVVWGSDRRVNPGLRHLDHAAWTVVRAVRRRFCSRSKA